MKEQIIEKIKKMIAEDEKFRDLTMMYYKKRDGTFTNHGSQIYSYHQMSINRMKEILTFVEGLR